MQVEKAAVFFDKIFNLMFLLIRWNVGIFGSFQWGSNTVGRMDIN